MKIVKHCHESLPHMVTGSLLGMSAGNNVLEITHSFPFPTGSDHKPVGGEDGDELEGHEFQMEMMRMLREVNVDNNCVGWYQSMYLGIYSTSSLLENQFSYQTELSPNAVVLVYDPMQTARGQLVLKCLRLTEECIKVKKENANAYIDPKKIFEEVPVKLSNPGLVRALLADLRVNSGPQTADSDGLYNMGADTTIDRLDLDTDPYLEKHLEFLCSWVDDLSAEQYKFQYYTRQLARAKKESGGQDKEQAWDSTDAPRRMESLLISNQITSYCDQMDEFSRGSMGKLYLSGGLHKSEA